MAPVVAEPRSFVVARAVTLVVLGLAVGGVAALSILRYVSSPVQLRRVGHESMPLSSPTLLLGVYEWQASNGSSAMSCRRVSRDSTGAVLSTPLVVQAGVTPAQGVQFDGPFSRGLAFSRPRFEDDAARLPWRLGGEDQLDLYLQCDVQAGNGTSAPLFPLGEVYAGHVSAVRGTDLGPIFSASAGLPLMGGARLAVSLLVSKVCLTHGGCSIKSTVASAQSFPLSPSSAGRATVTVQYRNVAGDSASALLVDVFAEERTFAELEVFSTIAMTLLLALVVYFLLMGHPRLDPFGLVKRFLLRADAVDYVSKVQCASNCKGEKLGPALDTLFSAAYARPLDPDVHRSRHSKEERQELTGSTPVHNATEFSTVVGEGSEVGVVDKTPNLSGVELVISAPMPASYGPRANASPMAVPLPSASPSLDEPVSRVSANTGSSASSLYSAQVYPRPPLPDLFQPTSARQHLNYF